MKFGLHWVVVVVVSCLLIVNTADARRFGGGRSLGKSWSSFSSSRSTYTHKSTPNNRNRSAFGGKSGTFKGALMGLLAGGLIGSLLFGGGFHGLQGMDILLLGLAAFLLFKFFAHSRRWAGHGVKGASRFHSHGSTAFHQHSSPKAQQTFYSEPSYAMGRSSIPKWFNQEAFVQGAKRHFMNLQAAWDRNDLDLIKSYCTPDFFQQIATQRSYYPHVQHTKVSHLEVQLIDILSQHDQLMVALAFSADIKANDMAAERVREVWTIVHDIQSAKGDWLVAGIEQQ